jgi:hypothetical protein
VLTRPGLYRIDVSPDRGRTTLMVREGEATLPTQGGMQQVLPGQTAMAEGLDTTVVDVRQGVSSDGFDTWSANRDRRYERSPLDPVRVAPDGRPRGPRRLRALGERPDLRCRVVPDARRGRRLGAVPQWLLDHGRRVRTDVGRLRAVGLRAVPLRTLGPHERPLGLVPGLVHRAPVLGAGAGRLGRRRRPDAGYGGPIYSWAPLAWGEPYKPWWGSCTYRCWTHYNRPYSVNLDDRNYRATPPRYINVQRPGGVTSVGSSTFTGQMPVRNHIVPVQPSQLTPVAISVPSMRTAPATKPLITPGRANTPAPASTVYTSTRRDSIGSGKPGVTSIPFTREARPAPSREYPANAPSAYAPPNVKPSPSSTAGDAAADALHRPGAARHRADLRPAAARAIGAVRRRCTRRRCSARACRPTRRRRSAWRRSRSRKCNRSRSAADARAATAAVAKRAAARDPGTAAAAGDPDAARARGAAARAATAIRRARGAAAASTAAGGRVRDPQNDGGGRQGGGNDGGRGGGGDGGAGPKPGQRGPSR